MKRGKGRDPTNPMPKNISLVQWFLIGHRSLLRLSPESGGQALYVPTLFRWSNGFSSAFVRCCWLSRSPGEEHFSCQKLFCWSNGFSSTLVRCCACLRNSGDEHFLCQKYFAGPMVSHRTFVRCCAYLGVPVTSTSRAKNILLVQWFLIGWGPDCLRGYVGSVLEMQGLGCSSPRFAGTEDPIRSSRSKMRPLRLFRRCGDSA